MYEHATLIHIKGKSILLHETQTYFTGSSLQVVLLIIIHRLEFTSNFGKDACFILLQPTHGVTWGAVLTQWTGLVTARAIESNGTGMFTP